MALKKQITKAEHTALNAALQIEYKADAGGETFTLDVTGFDDPAELRRALDREKQTGKDEKARADTEKIRADAADAKLEALGPNAKEKLKDITHLEKSWQDKLTTETGKRDVEIGTLKSTLEKMTVGKTASELAVKLGGAANSLVLEPHVKSRLRIEHNATGDPIIRVVDAAGQPSAASLTDLETEFRNDARYKSVIVVSNGSGGGAAGNGNKGLPGVLLANGDKKFKDYNEKERVDWNKRDPQGFAAAVKAAQDEDRAALNPRIQQVH